MNTTVQNNIGQVPVYRTFGAALIGFFVFIATCLGIVISLVTLMSSGGACYDLAWLFCMANAALIAFPIALITGVIAVRNLLRKRQIPHPVALPVLAILTMLVSWYVVAGPSQYAADFLFGSFLFGEIVVILLVGGIVFVTSLLFYDWFLNSVKGHFNSKIVQIITAILIVIAISFVVYNFSLL